MKKAYVFPGQGSQFTGMGKDLYENSERAKALFDKANDFYWSRNGYQETPEQMAEYTIWVLP